MVLIPVLWNEMLLLMFGLSCLIDGGSNGIMALSPLEVHAGVGQETQSFCLLSVVRAGSCVKLTGG